MPALSITWWSRGGQEGGQGARCGARWGSRRLELHAGIIATHAHTAGKARRAHLADLGREVASQPRADVVVVVAWLRRLVPRLAVALEALVLAAAAEYREIAQRQCCGAQCQ